MKKVIFIIFVCCILMSGCGKADSSEVKDNFQQITIGQMEQIGDVLKLKKWDENNYTCIVMKKGVQNDFLELTSKDAGKSWEIANLEWLNNMEFQDDLCAITSVDRTKDNEYLITYDILNDSYERKETKIELISNQKVKNIASYNNSANMVTGKVLDDVFAVIGQESVTVYDQTGEKSADIEQKGVVDLCEYNDNLLLVCEEGLVEYNKKGKKMHQYSEKMDVLLDKIREAQDESITQQLHKDIIYCNEKGVVYLLLKDGVYRYYLENEILEHVISDDKNIFAIGEAEGFIVTEQDEIYLVGRQNNDDIEFVGFFYDEEIPYFVLQSNGIITFPKDRDKNDGKISSLKIYSLENSEYIDKLVKRFEQQISGINIVYEVGMDEDNGLTTQDAINAFNTEMLSGDGADIIFMDGLNPETYIQNGQLLNLKDIKEENEKESLSPVLNTFEQDGGVYALPTRFSIPMILAEQSRINELKDPQKMCDYLKTAETGINDLFIYGGKSLYDVFFPLYANDIVQESDINKENLQQFIQESVDIYQACNAHNNEVDDMLKKEAPLQFDAFDGLNVIPGINNYTGRPITKWTDITIGQLRSHIGVLHLYTACDYMKSNGRDYTFNTISDVFIPKMIVSINKQCKDKDAAKEFVNYLLSDDVVNCENDNYISQSFGDYEQVGISVSKTVRDADAEKYRNMQYTITSNSDNGMTSKIQLHSNVTEQEAEVMEQCYANAKTSVYLDKMEEDIIVKYLDKVINDECSVQEATDNICYELQMYMQE